MVNNKEEVPTITGENFIGLDLLSSVQELSLLYMKLKGLFYVFVGVTYIIFKSESRQAGLAWVDFLTPEAVGIIWIFAGAISIIGSMMSSHSAKRVGFFMLIIVPTLLGSYFLISWIVWLLPLEEVEGNDKGLTTTVSYWAYGVSAYIMARIHMLSSGGVHSKKRSPHV